MENCPKCGKSVTKGHTYCTNCGCELNHSKPKTIHDYKIFVPEKPKYGVLILALSAVVAFVISFIAFYIPNNILIGFFVTFVFMVLLTVESYIILDKYREYDLKVEEYNSITDKLKKLLKSAPEQKKKINNVLIECQDLMKKAYIELRGGNPGIKWPPESGFYLDKVPLKGEAIEFFWDNIDASENKLIVAADMVRIFKQEIEDYYYTLKKYRDNNFPDFPVRLEEVPEPLQFIILWQKLKRLGLLDTMARDVYEKRKTRQVLADGFYNLSGSRIELGNFFSRSLTPEYEKKPDEKKKGNGSLIDVDFKIGLDADNLS